MAQTNEASVIRFFSKKKFSLETRNEIRQQQSLCDAPRDPDHA